MKPKPKTPHRKADSELVSDKVNISKNPGPTLGVTAHSCPADIAGAFLDAQGYRSQDGLLVRWYRSEWLRYQGKVFVLVPTEEFKAEIMDFLQGTQARAHARRSFVGDIVANLEGLCRMVPPTVTLPVRWNGAEYMPQPDCVVVQNGIVDLKELFLGKTKGVLTPHTPSFVSQICLPFEFKPGVRCPRWQKFLNQVLPDAESRQLLQEIFGYCLTFDTSQQKFFMFEGMGSNGKGVVTNVLTKLLGAANISNLPLESFGKDHDPVVTLGKLVNITSEVGDLDRVAEGLLKQFTGEDIMHFNPKYKTPFSAKPTARLLISTNVRPPFRDKSEGLWRRLILLPFSVTIDEKKRDTHLAERLVSELSGIFNWAVEGAQALRERKRFIEPKISQEAQAAFKRESNPARMFLEEIYIAHPGGESSKTDVYKEYTEFCDTGRYKALSKHNFEKEVERVFPKVKEARPRQGESRPRIYLGISSKESIERQKDDDWGDDDKAA